MGWESSDVVRFDLGSLLQCQTRLAKLKSAYGWLASPNLQNIFMGGGGGGSFSETEISLSLKHNMATLGIFFENYLHFSTGCFS